MSSEPASTESGRVPFVFSVDVDDFPGSEPGVEWVLDLLGSERAPGSFFIAGRFAERYPALVAEIRRKGHEIGCHGWAHGLDWDEDFGRMDMGEQTRRLRLASDAIEKAAGVRPAGFRAPYLSVSAPTLHALASEGFRWDSSVGSGRFDFGIGRVNRFGYLFAPRAPYHPDWDRPERRGQASLEEFPCSAAGVPFSLTTGRMFGETALRLVGSWVLRRFRPAVFLLHPWELVDAAAVEHGRPMPPRHLKRRGKESHRIVEAVWRSWSHRVRPLTFGKLVGPAEPSLPSE